MATVVYFPQRRPLSGKTKTRTVPRSPLEELAHLDDEAAVAAVKRGLPVRLIHLLSERLGLPVDTLAAPLQLTLRTLQRRLQEGRLGQVESERLHALVRLFFQAVEVLGAEAKAVHWLTSPERALGGRTPLSCAETLPGLRQVENELWRIQDVVYS